MGVTNCREQQQSKNVDDLATEGNQKLDKLLEEKGIKSITLEIAETLPREYSLGQGFCLDY